MFCINCGTELPPQAKFCPNCGTAVVSYKAEAEQLKAALEDAGASVDACQTSETEKYLKKCFTKGEAKISNAEKMQNCTGGVENGHEWVDLGLSVKWATCNIGADKPEEYGDYFAWGEIASKGTYEWPNYRFIKQPLFGRIRSKNDFKDFLDYYEYENNSLPRLITKYNTSDGIIQLAKTDDAARANWGGQWRMPTEAEVRELVFQCKWEWIVFGGKNGYKVSGCNGNSIFLPAAGCKTDKLAPATGSFGRYWSSTLYIESFTSAVLLEFSSPPSSRVVNGMSREVGLSVRPVTD